VLPKILAFRVPDKDAVEDVVQGLAAKKPQKLRQIGLNYDLAHAKAYSESGDKERVGKVKTEKEKEQPEGKEVEPPEEEKGEPSEEEEEGEPSEEEEEEPPEVEEDSSSVAAAPTSADTSTNTSNGPTSAPTPPAETSPPDSKSTPWNAVCVIGLRVYSKDAKVSVKLVKPRDAEEGAALDVDGVTPAGATM
jgi:hypothetical protein